MSVLRIDPKIFEKDPTDIVGKMTGNVLPVEHFDRLEYPEGGGIFAYYKVFRFPMKGIVPAYDILISLGAIKKLIQATAVILTTSPIKYLLPIILLFPRCVRKNLFLISVRQFVSIAEWTLDRWMIKPFYASNMVRELYYKTEAWINTHYKSEADLYIRLLKIFLAIPEYDSSYKNRLQDALLEINKVAFKKNPVKELDRIIALLFERERLGGVSRKKYKPFINVLKLLLLFKPSYKRAIIEIVDSLNMSGLSWEEFIKADFNNVPDYDITQRIGRDYNDWYFCANSSAYDFGGIGFYYRNLMRRQIDGQWVEKLRKENRIEVSRDGIVTYK